MNKTQKVITHKKKLNIKTVKKTSNFMKELIGKTWKSEPHLPVIPLFKAGELANISNCRPISVLPSFSNMFERIMYNHFYRYLTTEKVLYPKQFGFQRGHSTEHATVKLANQLYEPFERNKYILGVFIDLSKAFETISHSVLIKKLQMYGIRGISLAWFHSYLAIGNSIFR